MNTNHPAGLPEAPGWPVHPAMLSTTDQIPGFEVVRSLAIVHGWSVTPITGLSSASHAAKTEQARSQALHAMLQNAASFGANAVVAIRYSVGDGAASLKILAFGTSVIAQPK